MQPRIICWVCQGEFADPWPTMGARVSVDCKTCGRYDITASLAASAFPLADTERHRLSYWCKRHQLEGRDPPVLSTHTMPAILAQLPNPSTHEKPDLLLVSLTLRNPTPGQYFKIDDWRERSLACARDQSEFNFFLRCLIEREEVALCPPGIDGVFITGRGWERAAQLADRPETSKSAFVAMRFNAEMLAVWESAFAPAIKRAGFEPRLANDPQHNEQIDARIIAELKQCRFLIADVTFAATGVYFEAGYALGMGRSVIWTCRRDRHTTDMHFDTRQYNHILWDTAADLSEQLYYRIVATI
jgi:Nucleoside 2-deoxyribosyltransferase